MEVAGTDPPISRVWQTGEIKFWIMSWRKNARVLEPESLREEIRAVIEAMLHRYERKVERKGRPTEA